LNKKNKDKRKKKERIKTLENDLKSWKNMFERQQMLDTERITKLERKLTSFRASIGQCNSNLGEWVLKFGSRLEVLESVLNQGFDSIATYFAKMDQGDFAVDLRKLLKRLSDEQSDVSMKSQLNGLKAKNEKQTNSKNDTKRRGFEVIDHGYSDPTFEAGGLSITNQLVRCPHCGNEFVQRVESGCFYNNIEPRYCPKCGFPDIKINAIPKEQEQKPSAQEAIDIILNNLRITCLGCNKSYKFAELRIDVIFNRIYCPNCKHEFKTLKIKKE